MTGRVVDSVTGAGVPRASLQTVRGGIVVGTAADDDGRWSFPFLSGDAVRVSSVGYSPRYVPGASLPGTLTLAPLVEELPGITITPTPRRSPWPWVLLALALSDG